MSDLSMARACASGVRAGDMTGSQMFSPSRRPLTETERRVLRARIRSLAARGRRASVVALRITGGVVLSLWLWTILAVPARRIPAAVKQRLEMPDHLEVRKGRIADLENIFASRTFKLPTE